MKQRLDLALKAKYPQFSRQKIQQYILSDQVTVDQKVIDVVHYFVNDEQELKIDLSQPSYVSRASKKLIYALEQYHLKIVNKTCLDIGSSTGGFCQVLLDNQARLVYAVDVGTDQLDPVLRQNKKIILREQTNFLELTANDFIHPIEVITCDVSFISLTKILQHIQTIFPTKKMEMICLIKPQFELNAQIIHKSKGIIKQEKYWTMAIKKIIDVVDRFSWQHRPVIESPILGAKGNKEFLIYLKK